MKSIIDILFANLLVNDYNITRYLDFKSGKYWVAVDTHNPIKFTLDMLELFENFIDVKELLNKAFFEPRDTYYIVVFPSVEYPT